MFISNNVTVHKEGCGAAISSQLRRALSWGEGLQIKGAPTPIWGMATLVRNDVSLLILSSFLSLQQHCKVDYIERKWLTQCHPVNYGAEWEFQSGSALSLTL